MQLKSFHTLLVLASVCLISVGYAQSVSVWTDGVHTVFDRGVGQEVCEQVIYADTDSFSASVTFVHTSGEILGLLFSAFYAGDLHVISIFDPESNKVELLFADGTELTLFPSFAIGIYDSSLDLATDTVGFRTDVLVGTLLSLNSDVQVRLTGARGTQSMDFPAEAFRLASSGFGRECLGW